jgi:hypothetical protein
MRSGYFRLFLAAFEPSAVASKARAQDAREVGRDGA